MHDGPFIWQHSLVLPADFPARLAAFIAHPHSHPTVLMDQAYAVPPGFSLRWVVKYDLFQGTVVQTSLIDEAGGRYLAGSDRLIASADAIYGDYLLESKYGRYRLTVSGHEAGAS